MSRYHLIKKVFGGSDVYDEDGRQVGYSLPSLIGKGEDFYDMDGNPLGQSFEGAFGGMFFSGDNGSHGFLDEELMMGQNIYMHGRMEREREPDPWDESEKETPFGKDLFSDSPFGDDPFGSDSFNSNPFDSDPFDSEPYDPFE